MTVHQFPDYEKLWRNYAFKPYLPIRDLNEYLVLVVQTCIT